MVWVLERAYALEKAMIIQILNMLANSRVYHLQSQNLFIKALEQFQNTNAGFADTLINIESQQQSIILWTFDRKFAKQQNVQLLNVMSLNKFGQ